MKSENRTHLFERNYRFFFQELRAIISTLAAAIECARITEEYLAKHQIKSFEYDGNFEQSLSKFKSTNYKKSTDIRRQMATNLNKTLFVRLISALEVFMISQMKSGFMINKTFFMKNDITHSYNQAELLKFSSLSELRSKIIDSICRELSSRGYMEIIKSYKKYFEVNISQCPPGKHVIQKHHEYRHLIVHRLGRTDREYREKHGTDRESIHLEADHLHAAIVDFDTYAQAVTKLLVKK